MGRINNRLGFVIVWLVSGLNLVSLTAMKGTKLVTLNRWTLSICTLFCLMLNLPPGWGQEKPDIQLPEVVIVGQEERVMQDEKSLIQLHTMPIGLRGEVETGNIAQVAPPTSADFTGPAAENPGCLIFPRVQAKRDERLYRRGIRRFNAKDYAAARELFERLGIEYPSSPYAGVAVFWSAEAAYQQGQNEAALVLYERVVTQHQGASLRDYALFRAAQIRLERGDYVAAANHLDMLLAMYPASPTIEQALYLDAETSFRAGQFQTAIRSLQTFLQRYPQSPLQERAELWRAESLYQLQDYPRAREAYQHVLRRFPQGTFTLQARYGLAWTLLKAGEVKPARLLFQDLNLQTPDVRYEEAEHYASFMADMLNDDLDNAQLQWRQLQQRYPGGTLATAALSELAWAYFVRKDYAKALDFYQRLSQVTPLSEQLQNIAQYMMGESFYQQGQFAEAAQAFRQIRSESKAGLLEKAAFRLGLSLYHLKDFAQAIQVLQAFVMRYAASPYRDEVLFWLAESYFRQGNYPTAAESYRRIPEESQLYDHALHGIAWVYVRTQEWQNAIDTFRRLVNLFPHSSLHGDALYRMAESYQNLQQKEAAKQGYEQYLAAYPRGELAPAARLQLALLDMRDDRFEEAVETLRQLRLQFVGTEQATEAQYWLGMVFFRQEHFEAAREEFQSLVNTAPTHPRAAAALLRIADAYYNEKQFREALIAYQKIDILYPQTALVADAQYGAILSYLQLQQYPQFLREARIFIQTFAQHPLSVSLLLQVAEYYQQQERLGDAIKTYTRLVEQYPSSPLVDKAWFRLGGLFMLAGKPQQALLAYERLLQEGQNEALKPDALLGQGKAYEALSDRSAALQRYTQIADVYPESGLAAQGLYRAGRLLMTEENYQEAQYYFEAVVARYPDAPIRFPSLLQLGLAFIRLQQPAKAIERLQQALQAPDRHLAAQVQATIGRAYSDAGKIQESINAYMRVAYLYSDETELVTQALRQAARHYVVLKKCAEAVTVYTKLLKRISDAQQLQEVQREMAASGCP